ncbi:MAG TPA: hypothetical protein VM536_01825 [Chloroflexia bacterium]|nr:hypothetical protein [Chloroflexia bacterium]
MNILTSRVKPGRGSAGLSLLLGVALLAACDIGGSPAAPTPITGGVTPTATPVAPTVAAPTNTARPPTETPQPTRPAAAVPTARRTGNTTPGTTWRLIGLTGQELFAVAGTGQLDAPIYVGGTGVYRSDDGGGTWTQLGFDNRTDVDEIHVSLSNPKVIYAGSGMNCYGGPTGGQFRSDDGGDTWKPLKEAPSSLVVDPKNENLVVAMTCSGVVRSEDGGQTWKALADPVQSRLQNFVGETVRVAGSDNGIIYATYASEGGSTRIRRTTDTGKTWSGGDTDYPGVSGLLVDDRRPQRAWALAQTGVLRTSDGGATWVPDVTGLDVAHNTAAGSQGAYQLSGITAQYNTAGDLIEIYVGSYGTESQPAGGIFGTKDGGQVWSRFGGDLGGLAIHELRVARETSANGNIVVLYAATDDGVHKLLLNNVR